MDGIAVREDGVDVSAMSGALRADASGWEVAVDVGGTFVDVIAVSPDGVVHASKHARRGAAPAEAVLAAVDTVASVQGFRGADVTRWLHGTTIATNLLLEQDAAPVGVLVPRGFADVLTLGRQSRRDLYASHVGVQTPVDLMPEDLRVEIDGRLGADGREVEPLTRSSVVDALSALHAAGVRSVAICLLFSHCNPAHERQVAAWCAEWSPALQVSLSSDVDPRPREFERWLTTAMDAYVKPGVSAYLQALKAGLAQRGYPAPWVMRSFGGIAPVDDCAALPIALAMSGPAAAVNGVARMIDPATAASAAISIDIGGTSSDLSLLEQGAARYTQALAVGHLDLRVRSLDIVSIPLGGGSIVRVNAAGALRIGPDSAGARPGPAAYAQGGTLATVTDCLVVLGLLPERLASGLMLDRGKAEAAVNDSVAAPLGLSITAAAAAALAVANASLAEAIKRTAFAAGVNPREVTLVAAGGGGGLHVAEAAALVGARRVVVPPLPGVAAAYGLLRSPRIAMKEAAMSGVLDDEDVLPAVEALLRELTAALPAGSAAGHSERVVDSFIDVGYLGQEFALEVAYTPGVDTAATLAARFDHVHTRVRGQAFSGGHRVHAVRAVARWAPAARSLTLTTKAHAGRASGNSLISSTGLPRAEGSPVSDTLSLQLPGVPSCAVFARAALAAHDTGIGPALVTALDTTIWIPPSWRWTVDDDGVLILEAP